MHPHNSICIFDKKFFELLCASIVLNVDLFRIFLNKGNIFFLRPNHYSLMLEISSLRTLAFIFPYFRYFHCYRFPDIALNELFNGQSNLMSGDVQYFLFLDEWLKPNLVLRFFLFKLKANHAPLNYSLNYGRWLRFFKGIFLLNHKLITNQISS